MSQLSDSLSIPLEIKSSSRHQYNIQPKLESIMSDQSGEYREVGIEVLHGEVVVNGAYLAASSDDIACIIVDLATKHASVDGVSGGITKIGESVEAPTVYLSASEFSTRVNEVMRGQYTSVSFKDYPEWGVFAVESHRYSLHVTLVKTRSVNDEFPEEHGD